MGWYSLAYNKISNTLASVFNADPQDTQKGIGEVSAFVEWETRRTRYDFFWGLYQNNSYDGMTHTYADELKTIFGLPTGIQNVFNPTYKLTEFWTSHIFGGELDPAAGDGQIVPSAIPIVTDNKNLRAAIAKLWRDSNWQMRKSVLSRYGSLFGDVFIKVVDDPIKRIVYLDIVHPGHMKWGRFDPRDGSLKSYILEDQRYQPSTYRTRDLNPSINPKDLMIPVTYNEVGTVENGNLLYQTYLNYGPYNWRGQTKMGSELPDRWSPPYDFIPIVPVQHINFNMNWGMGEPHCMLSRIMQIDGGGSTVSGHLRRALNGPWLLSGMGAQKAIKVGNPQIPSQQPTYGNPQPQKQEIANLYGPPGSTAVPLTYGLDLGGANQFIDMLRNDIRDNWPELAMADWATGDTSGRAIRISREAIENKVIQRRPAYYESMVRAHKMALTIGIIQGYPGYEGFTLDSIANGDLEHTIGKMPIFANDVADDLDLQNQFWLVGKSAAEAGCAISFWLKEQGWTDERIKAMLDARIEEAKYPTPTGEARTQTRVQVGNQVAGGQKPSDAVGTTHTTNGRG